MSLRVVACEGGRDAIDAIAVHIDNLAPVSAAVEYVACPRHASQRGHRKPAEGMITLTFPLRDHRIVV
jgi:hypothetical protein